MEFLQGSQDKRQLTLNQDFLRDLDFETLPLTENIGHRASIYVEQYVLSHGMRAGDAVIAATAAEHGNRLKVPETPPKAKARHASRPALCAKYYRDGTDRWKDCMGVGYR